MTRPEKTCQVEADVEADVLDTLSVLAIINP